LTVAKTKKERWESDAAADDYLAAGNFLRLLLAPARVTTVVDELRRARVDHHRANDLLRAAHLPLLPIDDTEVGKDLKKVKRGEKLSPVLLVRGALGTGPALTIADGYHRICASYHLNEDADIPCLITELPASAHGVADDTRYTN
jgi:hypothetical protein